MKCANDASRTVAIMHEINMKFSDWKSYILHNNYASSRMSNYLSCIACWIVIGSISMSHQYHQRFVTSLISQ